MEEAYVYAEGLLGVCAALIIELFGRSSEGLSFTHLLQSVLQSLREVISMHRCTVSLALSMVVRRRVLASSKNWSFSLTMGTLTSFVNRSLTLTWAPAVPPFSPGTPLTAMLSSLRVFTAF